MCSATNDDEHAVSTDTAGPSSPNTYDTRPDATLDDCPVSRKPSAGLRGAHAVALGIDPGEHAGGAASQHGRVNTGPLQRFPGQLEEHPLLGIHRQRF